MARLLRTAILMASILSAGSAFAGTYYVSKSLGSDSNSASAAQSKSTPWAHLPGMVGATGNAASYSPVAGDKFILLGCDIWGASDIPVNWNWSGTSGNPISVTVDKTWYNTTNCPSGWNRPIFDSGDTVLTSACNADDYVCGGQNAESAYIVFEWIEMRGLTCTGGCSGSQSYIHCVNCPNSLFDNLYFHGLNIAYDNSGACTLFKAYETSQGPNVTGTVFEENVVDGSDRTNPSAGGQCEAFFGDYGGATITENVIHDVPNGAVPYAGNTSSGGSTSVIVSDNYIYNIITSNGPTHCNAIETLGGGTIYLIGNVIYNLECSGGESMMLGNGSETDYVMNNIIYGVSPGQTPNGPEAGPSTGLSMYFWNNTIVDPNGNTCFFPSGQTGSYTVIDFRNNHCISPASSALGSGFTVTTLINSNNLLQTASTADSNSSPQYDQYTSSETYVYSPVASTNSTVGAGTNLTSNWPGGFSTNDTSYACTQQTISGVVQAVCPARIANARPASGAWDVGAYQFSSSTAQAPQPPTNLQATVQ